MVSSHGQFATYEELATFNSRYIDEKNEPVGHTHAWRHHTFRSEYTGPLKMSRTMHSCNYQLCVASTNLCVGSACSSGFGCLLASCCYATVAKKVQLACMLHGRNFSFFRSAEPKASRTLYNFIYSLMRNSTLITIVAIWKISVSHHMAAVIR